MVTSVSDVVALCFASCLLSCLSRLSSALGLVRSKASKGGLLKPRSESDGYAAAEIIGGVGMDGRPKEPPESLAVRRWSVRFGSRRSAATGAEEGRFGCACLRACAGLSAGRREE